MVDDEREEEGIEGPATSENACLQDARVAQGVL